MSPTSYAAMKVRKASPVRSLTPKKAAAIIKREVTKKYAQRYYKSFTGENYRSIRKGSMPLHTSSILRRMKNHPIVLNTPIYRGIRSNKRIVNGKLLNRSFASFSKNKSVANRFAREMFNVNNHNGFILVLQPGKYPAINREKFIGNSSEREITLAPGTYTVTKRNGSLLHAKYTPF